MTIEPAIRESYSVSVYVLERGWPGYPLQEERVYDLWVKAVTGDDSVRTHLWVPEPVLLDVLKMLAIDSRFVLMAGEPPGYTELLKTTDAVATAKTLEGHSLCIYYARFTSAEQMRERLRKVAAIPGVQLK